MLPPRPALALLAALALAAPAAAAVQLDIPGRRGPVEPPKEDAGEAEGQEPERGPDAPGTPRGGLELPQRHAPAAPTPPAAPDARGDEELPAASYSADPSGAARFVLDQLLTVSDADASVALRAVESLGALGEPGLVACREALSSQKPATLVTAARVLALYGAGHDRERLAQRLRAPVPASAAEGLLRILLDADPVLGSPRFLIDLLSHPTGSMRAAAQRRLEPLLQPEHVPLLAAHVRSERADTRLRCVQLAGRLPADPAARRLLCERLADPAARVAKGAADVLAVGADEELQATLLERAFGARDPDRAAAYALLTLVEREDMAGDVVLDDAHVEDLLRWLRSADPLVAGASAAALAGVGFRSERSRDMAWLDRDVPHALVRLVSGEVFLPDFSSLRDPVQRRLALLSGCSFGSDGPGWQRWWEASAESFRARRAVLALAPEDGPALSLVLVAPADQDQGVRLLGPRAEEAEHPQLFPARRYYLSEAQCAELVLLLDSEGVFGVDRLPSRTSVGEARRVLDLVVGAQGKRFEVAGEELEPWLARVAAGVEELARRNRWQQFHDRLRYPGQRAFWEEEHAWWDEAHEPLARAQRQKAHVFAALATAPGEERLSALRELARLYDVPGVPAPEDFAPLLELLRGERDAGPRMELITALALRSAAGTGADGGLDAGLAGELQETLVTGFGRDAEEELVRVVEAGGDAGLERAARDARPLLRTIAVQALGRRGGAAAEAELLRLLSDEASEVELEAVRALGMARVESARNELFVRARLGTGAVRAEALRAVGRLGGEEAREVLMLGLADDDPLLQRAGVEGLGELADPKSASLLVSVFARGPDAPLFEPARAALLRLGDVAHAALTRLLLSAAPATRREAALLLSQEGAAEAASPLLQILTDNPRDARVAAELAVLTGVDQRGEPDPALAWWGWWDLVVHDDALAWLLGAAEAEGLRTPPREAFAGAGTAAAARFYVELFEVPRLHLQERARRELGRLLGRDLGDPPPRGAARDEWLAELEAEIEARWPAADAPVAPPGHAVETEEGSQG